MPYPVDKKVKSQMEIAIWHLSFYTFSLFEESGFDREDGNGEGHKPRMKKRIQGAKHLDLGKNIFFKWLCDVRVDNIPISVLLLKEEAD